MAQAVPLAAAAKELDVSVETMRRWCRQGAPVASAGGRGRGRGSRVDVAAVRAWRGEKAGLGQEALLREVALLALDFHRRGAERREAGWRLLGIPENKAAALVAFLLHYLAVRLLKVEELRTPETQLLEAIAINGRR